MRFVAILAMTLTIVLWNTFWRTSASPAGEAIQQLIAAERPDIVCLTESFADFLAGPNQISSAADYGLGPGRRRKVVLWSREPWRHADLIGSRQMPPGRFAAAETQTPLGPLRIVGICVPWSMAHVGGGRRDRKPWEEHSRYLAALAEVLAGEAGRPTILLGDFNQTVPRRRAPGAVYEQLTALLGTGFDLATKCRPDAIDHLAFRADLRVTSIAALTNADGAGRRLSDHEGVVVRLEQGALATT